MFKALQRGLNLSDPATGLQFTNDLLPIEVMQRTAKVVFIEAHNSSRQAVGFLKKFHAQALFHPNDERFPRLIVAMPINGTRALCNIYIYIYIYIATYVNIYIYVFIYI